MDHETGGSGTERDGQIVPAEGEHGAEPERRGRGQGTQGALIAAHFDIPHIATGELLREHVARRTALGLAVQEYLDRGELVPDQVVLDMVREEVVAAREAGGGFA